MRLTSSPLLRFFLGVLLLAAPACAQERFQTVDSLLEQAVRAHEVPGAVLVVGHDGQVVYRKAFGLRSLEPTREPMTVDTIFDLASLTKPVATAMSVMRLVELGQVRLNDPVARYLPEFAQNGKREITVRQLLTHFSGLPPDLDLKASWQGKQEGLRRAFAAAPIIPPGSAFLYSDINYIVLGALVERVSGMALDEYAARCFFQPLGMTETRFLPPESWRSRIAPTQYDRHGRMLRGVVHDPTARRMGGVAGHAGLFSTADDLSKLAQAILDHKVLTPGLLEKMTTPQQPATSTVLYGLGWDIDSPYSTARGDLLPVGSFGHTGFTGTSIWIDPATRTYIILLTNAVHPRGGKSAVSLRTRVATAVTEALDLTVSEQEKLRLADITGYNETLTGKRHLQARNGQVETGIDVLEEDRFDLFPRDGKKHRIGLLTNQTGVDREGRRTVDVLAHAPGLELAAVFSPEHGLGGDLDQEEIGDTTDAATGVPVYSLYRKGRRGRPPQDLLRGLEALVVDLQDFGVRYSSYEVMLGYTLEAAAAAGVEVVVLDRPDPITGSMVQGPMSGEEKQTVVNYLPLPIRHGMTLGELAQMFNGERHIAARLRVIAMQGWQRGDWYDSTGLEWVDPSPNLRSLTEATLYPAVSVVEGTNVSVGRGTETPFEVLGAPWIQGRELAADLNARRIAGVRFLPVRFTPASGPYAGQACQGVNLILLRRGELDAPELGLELAAALRRLYPQDYKIERLSELLDNPGVYQAVLAGEDPRRIAQDWQAALQEFEQRREKYLLY